MDNQYNLKDIEKALDLIPYYIWIKDGNGVYRYVNKAFADVLNVKKEFFIGKTDFDFGNEKMANQFETSDNRVRESGLAILSEDKVEIKSINKCLYFETFKQKFYINGEYTGWIMAIARNTTLYKRLDDSIEYEFNNISNKIFNAADNLEQNRKNKVEAIDDYNDRILKIIKELQNNLKATGISIFIYEKQEKKFKLFLKTCFDEEQLPSDLQIKIDDKMEYDFLNDKYREFLRINDVRNNIENIARVKADASGYINSISIKYGNELIGLLNVYYAEEKYPTVLQNDFIESATYKIGLLIKNRMLTNQLKSEIDKKLELEKIIAFENLKTDFLANLSHEFKTPINILLAASKMINTTLADNKDTYKDAYKDSINKYNNYIISNSYRLLKMVNNLFDITNIDKGYYELNLQLYNVVSIIENITMTVVKYLGGRRKIVFDTKEEEIISMCDYDSIEKVMLNLLSNAVKNTDSNNLISVTVKRSNDNKNIVVSVKNDGKTIDEKDAEFIFEKFTRLGSVLSRDAEGSGLGLCLARSLAQLQDGDLWLNTNEKKNCEFIFTIPIYKNYDKDMVNTGILNNSVEKCAIEFSDIYSI